MKSSNVENIEMYIHTRLRTSIACGKMPFRTLQHDKSKTWAAGTGVE